jgi:hypothetical protein
LQYNIEIGELHERDKFSWIETIRSVRGKQNIMKGRDDGSDSDEYLIKKIKTHDFEF